MFVELFGQSDKLVLNLMIVGASILVAGLLGVAGSAPIRLADRRVRRRGRSIGLLAALRQPLTEPLLALVTVVVAIGGALVALRMLLRTDAAGVGDGRRRCRHADRRRRDA